MNLVRTGPASRRALLTIYLNDHLAGAVAGLAVARRSRGSNPDPPLSVDLDRLIAELVEDRRALEQVMELLQVRRTAWKQAAVGLATRAGVVKLNGQLTGYSDLSRLIELEALTAGVTAKRSLWESIAVLQRRTPRLAEIDTAALVARADRQLAVLALHRAAAADVALP